MMIKMIMIPTRMMGVDKSVLLLAGPGSTVVVLMLIEGGVTSTTGGMGVSGRPPSADAVSLLESVSLLLTSFVGIDVLAAVSSSLLELFEVPSSSVLILSSAAASPWVNS